MFVWRSKSRRLFLCRRFSILTSNPQCKNSMDTDGRFIAEIGSLSQTKDVADCENNSNNVKQGTDDWHKLRQGRLTSSCFAAALGFWGINKVVHLWEEKVGLREHFAGNDATEWGSRHEHFALERYQEASGNVVQSLGFKIYREGDDLLDWLGASPDGLVDEGVSGVYENGGILEVKCPYNNGKPELCTPWVAVPYYYMPQIQGLMEILDKDWLDLFVWTMNGSCIFRLERNAQYWALIFGVLSDFWWVNVVPGKQGLMQDKNSHRPIGLHRLTNVVLRESKQIAKNALLQWKGPVSNPDSVSQLT